MTPPDSFHLAHSTWPLFLYVSFRISPRITSQHCFPYPLTSHLPLLSLPSPTLGTEVDIVMISNHDYHDDHDEDDDGVAQRIRQRGKKRAYLAQPKSDWGQTWPSLALALSWAKQVTCAQLGPNLRQTRASWLQLGPTLSPTGSNMAQLGNVWAQVGAVACATWPASGA